MRPSLQVLTPQQIDDILADAKRILAETGIEVRGAALRQRLLDAGLPRLRLRRPAGPCTW